MNEDDLVHADAATDQARSGQLHSELAERLRAVGLSPFLIDELIRKAKRNFK